MTTPQNAARISVNGGRFGMTQAIPAPCVPVPVVLLQRVADLVTCRQDGIWCDVHDAAPWPCPMTRLLQYIPEGATSDAG